MLRLKRTIVLKQNLVLGKIPNISEPYLAIYTLSKNDFLFINTILPVRK